MNFLKFLIKPFKQAKKPINKLDLQKAVIRNGHISERAKMDRHSLTKMERNIITSVRRVAAEYGFTKEYINYLEMSGERDKEIVFQPLTVKAKFAYFNSGDHPTNPMPEFLVIKSNHPALAEGGNYSQLDFEDAGIETPKYPSFSSWDKNGRPCFRG